MSKLKIDTKSLVVKAIEKETETVDVPKADTGYKHYPTKAYNRFGCLRASTRNVTKHRPTEFLSFRHGKRGGLVGTLPHESPDYKSLKTYRQVKLFLASVREGLEDGDVLVFKPAGEPV